MLVTGDDGESIPLLCTRLARGSDRSARGPLQLLLQPRLPAFGWTKNSESSDGCSFHSSSATQSVKTFHIHPQTSGTELCIWRLTVRSAFRRCTALITPSTVSVACWTESWELVRIGLDAAERRWLFCSSRGSKSYSSVIQLIAWIKQACGYRILYWRLLYKGRMSECATKRIEYQQIFRIKNAIFILF